MTGRAVRSALPHTILSDGDLVTRETAEVGVTSQALDWPGVLLEAGRNDVAEVNDSALALHHYLSFNADHRPLVLHIKGPHGFQSITVAPGSVWLVPAGESVTLRVRSALSYVRLAIEARFLERLLDGPVTLRRSYGVATSQIEHVLRALVAEAQSGNPGGLAFVEALMTALGRQLLLHAGAVQPHSSPARGGLSSLVRHRVLELIEARLDARLTVAALAHEAGLSPAHFARAFKESLGRAPHQYLLHLRLERARHWLESPGAGLSDVALRAGFADQAHFTRLFKREFGVTPGALWRSRRT